MVRAAHGEGHRGRVPREFRQGCKCKLSTRFSKIPLGIHTNTPFKRKIIFFSGEGLAPAPRSIDWLSRVWRPTKHIIGHIGDAFYGSNDPTNSVKALKEVVVPRIRLRSHQVHLIMLQQISSRVDLTPCPNQAFWLRLYDPRIPAI